MKEILSDESYQDLKIYSEFTDDLRRSMEDAIEKDKKQIQEYEIILKSKGEMTKEQILERINALRKQLDELEQSLSEDNEEYPLPEEQQPSKYPFPSKETRQERKSFFSRDDFDNL